FIYGTPDDVVSRIEEFVKAGAEHFVLTPLVRHSDYIPTVKLIAEEVMHYFKDLE
ncbi:LLM class flavin-dependent oxidoreductase, partial [Archaeoglobales archaeon]